MCFAFGDAGATIGALPAERLHGAPTELWLTDAIITQLDDHTVLAQTEGLSLLEWRGPIHTERGLTELTQLAYVGLIARARELATREFLRIWNFMPDINVGLGDDERYRQFCVGRAQALDAAGMSDRQLCAGTAIGLQAGTPSLIITALLGREPGVQIENPRQVSAYDYPRCYSPRSPSFARATGLPVASPWGLVISGTASVVGHRTLHIDDCAEQTRETLRNIDTLVQRAATVGTIAADADWRQRADLRVYLRSRDDLTTALDVLAQDGFAADRIPVLRSDICRSDLLIEIEARIARRR